MERRSFLRLAGVGVLSAAGGPAATALAATTKETTDMFSAAYLVKRKSGMSYEDYSRHQAEVHVPMAHALPGLRSYRYIDFPPMEGEDQMFDGLALVEFDDKAAHDAALASEAGQSALADLPTYLDTDAMRVLAGSTVSRKDAFA
ncbi:MAG: EthD family reductase [Pseudomonadota bacterium]